jgi:hypothetical protein
MFHVTLGSGSRGTDPKPLLLVALGPEFDIEAVVDLSRAVLFLVVVTMEDDLAVLSLG